MSRRSIGCLLALSVLLGVVCWATAATDQWDVMSLVVLMALAAASELLATRLENGAWVSASALAIVCAAVLDGPAPAAAVGAAAMLVGWVRTREPPPALVADCAIVATSAVLAAFAFLGLRHACGLRTSDPGFYVLVVPVFAIEIAANVLGVAVYTQARDGLVAVLARFRELAALVVGAQLLPALLSVGAVWILVHLHLAGCVMLALILATFQYLLGELLTSKRRGAALHRIATTDDLTGLGNRETFRAAVRERIELGSAFAVLLLDLDRFKEVNDTLGHMYGDLLLRDLGPRLQEAVGRSGAVARLGGDEFGIVLSVNADDVPTLEAVVMSLLGAVSMPFTVDELALEVGGSIGVARFPADGRDSDALLRCADIAMYAAKEAQTGYKLYAAEQNQHSRHRLNVLSDIRHALSSEQIVVHYQPIVDLAGRHVTGAEGLVRWQHPEHGLIPPGAFVQTVEQSGLIGPLTRNVLEQAIAQCAGWRADGRDLSIAVNLSVRNLLDRDLPREIERMLDAAHLPADALQLEITESMIMSDPERALATVSRLSDLGIRLSVDDFGTGHSSLANLRRLPIDDLKIDRSFVSPMLKDESDLIIVRSTINLGHDLGLRIVAEGVEDAPTLDRLAMLGCDLAQGYHLSRPLAAGAFTRWLADAPQRGLVAGRSLGAAPVRGAGPWTIGGGLLVAAPEP